MGFTLIELIVVMAAFLIIIGTAVSIFISVVSHQRRILARQELLNQTSYAIENMAKALRMAGKAKSGDCIEEGLVYQVSDNGRSIKFINQIDFDQTHPDGVCQEFFLDWVDPNNHELGSVLKERKNNGEAIQVTSVNLNIGSLGFILNGDAGKISVPGETDAFQPRVTISFNIKIQGDSNQPEAKIQTTVSQRDLNK